MQFWNSVLIRQTVSGSEIPTVRYIDILNYTYRYRYFWIIHIANTDIWTYTGIPDISGISILSIIKPKQAMQTHPDIGLTNVM